MTRLARPFSPSRQLTSWLRASSCQRRRLATTTPPSTINILGKDYPTDSYTNIPQSILPKLNTRLYSQPAHPLCTLKQIIESHFASFASITPSSPLVTPAQNFDDLSFPLDHPGRSVTDSYYVNKGLMLRTHTSVHEVEVFSRGEDRWLLTADVYRRDEIDASHYPVFHQMEGANLFDASREGVRELEEDNARRRSALAQEAIAIEDNTRISDANPYQSCHDPAQAALVTENLKHALNGLMLRLFAGAAGVSKANPLKVRWIEAYFPFTTPSYEVEVFFQGKWLEILGCGVVQQATLDRSAVRNKIGWAFGLGLERIAMILYSIPDIRLFWSTDSRFLTQFTPGKISKFQPYSKFPACYKDISFWLPPSGMHDNDFCDLVRTAAGDIVESVSLIDSFTHPKTSRSSVCYRINYRSMDRSLSNDEVNVVHADVASRLAKEVGAEIR